MNRIDLARAALNLYDPERYSYFSDDFQFTDELGSPPLDRGMWIASSEPVYAALPDLAHVIDEIREEGDNVVVKTYMTGTFANDLDLSAVGLGVIPATGKALRAPTANLRLSFDGDKVSRIHNMDTGPDAGAPGFFKALGVNMG